MATSYASCISKQTAPSIVSGIKPFQVPEMASHGVARTARARTKEQREQDLEKILKYRALEDQLRLRLTDGHFGREMFQLTSQLLRLNPEYYTVWNVRRRCLTSGLLSRPSDGSSPSKVLPSSSSSANPTPSSGGSLPSSLAETRPSPESQRIGRSGAIPEPSDGDIATTDRLEKDEGIIRSELAFTLPLLVEYPKCYWIWKYRLWMLDQAMDRLPVDAAREIWEEELGLVAKMLHKDRRNFHAWGYRRHVVSHLESPALGGRSMAESEFEYTTKMIHMDLSNFSAWHSRSQLIPRLLAERGADANSRKGFLDAELTLVRNALNVGPEDQSLWYYHQYLLLNLAEVRDHPAIAPRLAMYDRKLYVTDEITNIRELLEDYTDIKWIYEALIEYTLALCQLDSRPLDSLQREDVAHWLGKLRDLDPKRSGRWGDLETELGLG
ncbi:Geranylgeranyl transferase type-2 subunit alpha [Tolypocladium capitatum]|uniref:Geranylgeranyl transferase type-2 subunit alpha n=1 Tax=Tolypocladium capitatum TaxID=45235 RepID=A0A2K3QC19_9HYPO|nr:Geranylgeranyl transferase type-2 subunit alpha [Tolypocladium capitatum]